MKTLAAIVVASCLALVQSGPHHHYLRQSSGESSTVGTGPSHLHSQLPSAEDPHPREFYDVDAAIAYYGEDNLARFFGGDKRRMRDHLLRSRSLEVDGSSLEDLFHGRPQLQVVRQKRQAGDYALGLAGSHTDRFGNDRQPFSLHGRVDASGGANDLNNYNVDAGAGLGTVLWRSDNGRHSVGAGVYGSQSYGSNDGYRYQSRPDYGAGVVYKLSF